jgi:hypothetical protein
MTLFNPRNFFYIRAYAFAMIGIGLLLALSISKSVSLNCDRTTDRCQLQSSSLLQSEQRTFSIQALKGATIEAEPVYYRYSHTITGYTYRVLLLPDRTPLTIDRSGDKGPHQIAQEIDTFVKNPQQRLLQVSQDERWMGILLCISLNIAGILLLKRCAKS